MAAVQTGDVNQVVFAGQPRHHLHDARISRLSQLFHAVKQGDFGGGIQAVYRIGGLVHRFAVFFRRRSDVRLTSGRADDAHGFGGTADAVGVQAVGIGKGGFLARHRAHAHALVDLETARFDHAFFQMPAFESGALAVDVGIIDVVRADGGQAAGKVFGRQAVGGEQVAADGL